MTQGKHVLHIENDEVWVKLVDRLMQRHGVQVTSHYVQTEADLQFLDDWINSDPHQFDQFSAIITDQRSVGTDRFAERPAEKLKAAGIDVPVIALSGDVRSDIEAGYVPHGWSEALDGAVSNARGADGMIQALEYGWA